MALPCFIRDMKRLLTGILTGLMAGFFMTASAGPPPGGQVRMIPFRTYCHPNETLMVAAVMQSFGQHISITSDVNDGMMTLYIFENPEDKSLSIMATSRGAPPLESCLIFSGENVQHFVRPTMMPPRSSDRGDEA